MKAEEQVGDGKGTWDGGPGREEPLRLGQSQCWAAHLTALHQRGGLEALGRTRNGWCGSFKWIAVG